MSLEVERVVVGALGTNCYVVGTTCEVFIVDPGAQSQYILRAVGDRKITAVLVTHGHSDHIGAVDELVTGGVPVYINGGDVPLLNTYTSVATPRPVVDDGDLTIAAVRLKVIHSPGHTPGSICFYAPAAGVLFSGDTLFAGGIGRTCGHGDAGTTSS